VVACQAAGEAVDFNLGDGDAGGGVVVHLSHVGILDVADIGGLVEAARGEFDAVEVGGVRDLGEMRFDANFLML